MRLASLIHLGACVAVLRLAAGPAAGEPAHEVAIGLGLGGVFFGIYRAGVLVYPLEPGPLQPYAYGRLAFLFATAATACITLSLQ